MAASQDSKQEKDEDGARVLTFGSASSTPMETSRSFIICTFCGDSSGALAPAPEEDSINLHRK